MQDSARNASLVVLAARVGASDSSPSGGDMRSRAIAPHAVALTVPDACAGTPVYYTRRFATSQTHFSRGC